MRGRHAREVEEEVQRNEAVGNLFGFVEEPEAPHVHTFAGPHEHRCPTCGDQWTHQDRMCATPNWFATCPVCRGKDGRHE